MSSRRWQQRAAHWGTAAERFRVFKNIADRICCCTLKQIHDKEINELIPDIFTSFYEPIRRFSAYQDEMKRIQTLWICHRRVCGGGSVIESFWMPPVVWVRLCATQADLIDEEDMESNYSSHFPGMWPKTRWSQWRSNSRQRQRGSNARSLWHPGNNRVSPQIKSHSCAWH